MNISDVASVPVALNFFDILLAVIVGNAATAALIFVFVRIRRTNAWDRDSLMALAFACAVGISAGYFAT